MNDFSTSHRTASLRSIVSVLSGDEVFHSLIELEQWFEIAQNSPQKGAKSLDLVNLKKS
jgi:hypothetical protein